VLVCNVNTPQISSDNDTCISNTAESAHILELNACSGRTVLKVPAPISVLHAEAGAAVKVDEVEGRPEVGSAGINANRSVVEIGVLKDDRQVITVVDVSELQVDSLKIKNSSLYAFTEGLKVNSLFPGNEKLSAGHMYMMLEADSLDGQLRVTCDNCYELSMANSTMLDAQIEEMHLSSTLYIGLDLVIDSRSGSFFQFQGAFSDRSVPHEGSYEFTIGQLTEPTLDLDMEKWRVHNVRAGTGTCGDDFEWNWQVQVDKDNASVYTSKYQQDFDLWADAPSFCQGEWGANLLSMPGVVLEKGKITANLSGNAGMDTDLSLEGIRQSGKQQTRIRRDFDTFSEGVVDAEFSMDLPGMSVRLEDYMTKVTLWNHSGVDTDLLIDVTIAADSHQSRWRSDFDAWADVVGQVESYEIVGMCSMPWVVLEKSNVKANLSGTAGMDIDLALDGISQSGEQQTKIRRDFDTFSDPGGFADTEWSMDLQSMQVRLEDYTTKVTLWNLSGVDTDLAIDVTIAADSNESEWRSDFDVNSGGDGRVDSYEIMGMVSMPEVHIENWKTVGDVSNGTSGNSDFEASPNTFHIQCDGMATSISDFNTTALQFEGFKVLSAYSNSFTLSSDDSFELSCQSCRDFSVDNLSQTDLSIQSMNLSGPFTFNGSTR